MRIWTEVYENVSFNIDAPNYITEKRPRNLDLITAACAAGGERR
ncbi:MAG: hypothetical protein ACLU48_04260 [Clostridiaceae bacterium]